MKKKKENRWRLHSLLRKSTPTNLKSIVWPAAMLCIENCGVRRRRCCCRFNVWNSFLVCTYLHTIAAVLCIGFESAVFCLHSFTTVDKSKISESPNDCGGRFVYRYYIINSDFIVQYYNYFCHHYRGSICAGVVYYRFGFQTSS